MGEEEEEEEWKGLAEKALCEASERITVDSFNAWRLKFDLELIEQGIIRREGENKAKSGKLIFMGAGKEGDKGSKEAGKEDASPTVYNAALFGEVDDEDLDDLSDGED